jgi:NitT/TauT family transport system ATP-binding protein
MSTGKLAIPLNLSASEDDASAGAVSGPAFPLTIGAKPNIGRLVLQRVNKRFANSNVSALADISLHCEPGEFVVVVGPSGCGKTTLLNIAAGITRPDDGTATLDGKPIRGPGPDRAMVFQDHGLFPWLTASQNIEFGLKMAGIAKAERRDRVREVLQKVYLTAAEGKLVHELSGGMRQRVAIARAMVMNPAVLLMDEPFAALDAQTRTELHHWVQSVWVVSPRTILFVTHSVGEAVRLADRIIVLHAHPGRIRKEICVQLPHPRRFDSPDINELAKLVRKEIEDEVNRVNALADQDSWRPQEIADLASSIDDLGGGI